MSKDFKKLTAAGLFRIHTWFPFLWTSDNQYITVSYPQHLLCSIWNYTDIIIARCQYAVNNPHNILSNFYHFIYIPHFFPTRSNFICFKNASAFLLRDARHAMHDILLLRISAILPEAISDGGLTPTTDTNLLLATWRGGSHLTSDILPQNVLTKQMK